MQHGLMGLLEKRVPAATVPLGDTQHLVMSSAGYNSAFSSWQLSPPSGRQYPLYPFDISLVQGEWSRRKALGCCRFVPAEMAFALLHTHDLSGPGEMEPLLGSLVSSSA